MLKNITSLTGNGLKDWLIQRTSSIIITVFILFLLGFFLTHPNVDFAAWQSLFSHNSMRLFTLLTLLGLVLHTWIGIWTVLTDYIKCAYLRLMLQIAVILSLLIYFAWGIEIMWGKV